MLEMGSVSVMDMVLTRCEVQKSKLVWGKCPLSKFNPRDKIKPEVKFSLPIDKRFVKGMVDGRKYLFYW